ncbi:MAG: hypothetical protein KDC26_07900 [Armatimonadetes bacterium]|nr:hypothetical protein [Armatimonadota bacterium]
MWLSLAGMRQNDGAVEAPPPIRDDVRKMLTDRTKVMVNFYLNLFTALWAPFFFYIVFRAIRFSFPFLVVFTVVIAIIAIKHAVAAKVISDARKNIELAKDSDSPISLIEASQRIKFMNWVVMRGHLPFPIFDFELREVKTISGDVYQVLLDTAEIKPFNRLPKFW